MKQFFYSFLFLVVFISCQQQVTPDSIPKINGYWEIQKVEFADGQTKEYTVNETVDYFEWNQNKGFRKKVKPQFDGTFLTNDESEAIKISDSSGVYKIEYKTSFTQWSEEIIEITDSVLVLKNKQNFKYRYKRYKPFSIK